MSALPPKADVNGHGAGGPLLTHSGSRGIEPSIAASCYGIALIGWSNGRVRVNVEAWLKDLGLAHYAKAFAENGVDLDGRRRIADLQPQRGRQGDFRHLGLHDDL